MNAKTKCFHERHSDGAAAWILRRELGFDSRTRSASRTMRLRRRVVPNLMALIDSTQSLVRALQALADEGKQDEAIAILQEQLKEAPSDEALLKLLHALEKARVGTNSQPAN